MTENPTLATEQSVGHLEAVAEFYGAMPTGVTVSPTGRIFVCYPKWGDDVRFTVAEIRDGREYAYPSEEVNQQADEMAADRLISVQSVVVDPAGRLWILDTASPMFEPVPPGTAKLVCVDLETDTIIKTIAFPPEVVLSTSYVNDVRFDLRRGSEGMAFITDSSDKGPNGIIVVDIATGESWRRLSDHDSTKALTAPELTLVVEGQPLEGVQMGSDGIAISADGSRLYYCPLASRRLFSVSIDALADRSLTDDEVAATVRDEGDKGGAADGLESDAEGSIYSTNYEHNAIMRQEPGSTWQTVVHDERLLWPDTLSVATDGYLYVTANQLHRQARFRGGQDMRQRPFTLFRTRIDAHPVMLS